MTRVSSTDTYHLGAKPVQVVPPEGCTVTIANGGTGTVHYAEGPEFIAGKGRIAPRDSRAFRKPAWIAADSATGANVIATTEAGAEGQ